MTGVLLSFFYLALFCVAGFLLATFVLPAEDTLGRLAVALGSTVALLAWLPALPAFLLGFHPAAIAAGAAICLLLALLLWQVTPHNAFLQGGLGRTFWLCIAPALALSCYLLITHTLRPAADGGLLSGQSTYGDLPMHLAFIGSIAETGTFPPVYPLLAGNIPMSYPFLSESISSVFLVLGLPLRAAVLLPQFVAMAAVFCGFLAFAKQVLGHGGKTALAFWLFFMGSGFGFFYFLGGAKGNFSRIFTAFYETPTNDVEQNIVWVNPVLDLLVPQRATLFGWAVLLPCLYLLWRLAFTAPDDARPLRVPVLLGVLAGALPLIHTHSFLALFVVSTVLCLSFLPQLLRKPRIFLRKWGPYLLVAGLLALPQVLCFTLGPSGAQHFMHFAFNWVNAGKDNYFWFYIKNIGVVYLLITAALFYATGNQRRLYAGGLALLLLCEVVVFQPNAYDNNKLLYIWHLFSCLLAANLLWDLATLTNHRAIATGAVSLAVVFATFGSVLSTGRELVSKYEQFNQWQVQAAAYLKANTPASALVLTSDNHNNAPASLAARTIVCGSGSYLFFHGLDYTAQYAAMQQMFSAPSRALLEQWGVDYVWCSSYERSRWPDAETWYAAHYPVFYQNGSVTIYQIGNPS